MTKEQRKKAAFQSTAYAAQAWSEALDAAKAAEASGADDDYEFFREAADHADRAGDRAANRALGVA